MKRTSLAMSVSMALIQSTAAAGALQPYDDFRQGWINPDKWSALPMCTSGALDCVREARQGALRLALVGLGGRDSNTGTRYNSTGLAMLNPEGVTAIQANFVVNSHTEQACPANADPAHPQFLLHGSFFNTGSGLPADDVQAFVQVERLADEAGTPAKSVRVGGFMYGAGRFFNNIELGTVEIGERASIQLRWQPDQHLFTLHLRRARTAPSSAEGQMRYTLPDGFPAATPFRHVSLNAFSPNCVESAAFSAMDVSVESIRIAR